MSGKRRISYFDEETTSSLRKKLARMFSLRATLSFLRYVFAGRKRIIDDQSFIGMSDTKNINDKNGSIILIECSKRGRKID